MSIILRQNENLVKIVRKHTIFLLPVFFVWPWLIVATILTKYLLKFDFFGYWNLSLATSVIIAVLAIFYKYYIWLMDSLVITDQRVIENDQGGLFSKTITELLHQDILEISYSKNGISASMYNFGDIKIRTAAENEIIIEKIPKPEEILEIINTIRQKRQ